MRTIKLISAVLLVAMMTLTSCSKDDFNPSPFAVTTWEGDLNGVNAKMYFFENTCTLMLTHNYTGVWTSEDYSFKDNKNVIVFTPLVSGKAILKGVVTENIMVVTNESTGKVIAKMYKQ